MRGLAVCQWLMIIPSLPINIRPICTFLLVIVFATSVLANSEVQRPSMMGLHVVPSPFVSNSSLEAAAAIADNDIWAVGSIGSGSGPFQTLAEHFDGTSWSVVPTPSGNALFSGVAGAASNDVWAVGRVDPYLSSEEALIEHWNGTSWSVVASPRLPKGSFLIAVAAPVSNDVWAVGVDSSSSNALIEHWNGVSWSIVSSPAFTNQSATAISADSSTDVWTVGSFGAGTAALHWNGVTWSQVPTARLRFGGVSAVAALSAINVWAVGVGPTPRAADLGGSYLRSHQEKAYPDRLRESAARTPAPSSGKSSVLITEKLLLLVRVHNLLVRL